MQRKTASCLTEVALSLGQDRCRTNSINRFDGRQVKAAVPDTRSNWSPRVRTRLSGRITATAMGQSAPPQRPSAPSAIEGDAVVRERMVDDRVVPDAVAGLHYCYVTNADFAVILRRQLNVSSWGAHFVISMSLVLVQWSNATTILPSSKTEKRRGCSGGQANSFDEWVYIR